MEKTELVARMLDTRERLLAAAARVPEEKRDSGHVVGDWTLKDVLAHIARWEGELVTLMWQLAEGDTPTGVLVQRPMPVDEFNLRWHEQDRQRSWERVMEDLVSVRRQTLRRLEALEYEELESTTVFGALGDVPLAAKIAANTFEHDEEHLPQIEAWMAAG